ncbi:MAG: gluconokinase [Cyclobacteriaceae bacterium]|nr:gluconokinase [Cyclobacteriaceae bacterium]
MSNKPKIGLAIDIGTSNIKTLVVDADGKELFSNQFPCVTHHPEPGFSEQDAEKIFRDVCRAIQSCPTDIKSDISFISLSSAMHSVMAVDEHGNPLTPLIIWSDLRSKEESNSIRKNKQLVDQLVRTGTPVHPMSPLCKLMWWQKNVPEIIKRAHKFIGIKEYIWYRFFECYEVDFGIASATGLLDIEKKSWFGPALELADIKSDKLSAPVSVYHHRSISNNTLLSELGLPSQVPVVIGSSDGCLAQLGSGAMDSNALSLTIGTSGAVRRVIREKNNTYNPFVFRYLLDEDTVIEGGATNNGAVLIDWFRKSFLNETISTEKFIERAFTAPPGADGLLFLPYIYGERAPLYDPDASGIFLGMHQQHRQEHVMRALLEGIVFALYDIATLIESNSGAYEHIVASGGFVRSLDWIQLVADVFGRPVHVPQREDASAWGAALLGFSTLDIPTHVNVVQTTTIYPNESVHQQYKVQREQFKKLQVLSQSFRS